LRQMHHRIEADRDGRGREGDNCENFPIGDEARVEMSKIKDRSRFSGVVALLSCGADQLAILLNRRYFYRSLTIPSLFTVD
jgi:hypothetical protein